MLTYRGTPIPRWLIALTLLAALRCLWRLILLDL